MIRIRRRIRIAMMFDRLTYKKVITDNLRVMDMTAITLAMERKIPIMVFNLRKPGNIAGWWVGRRLGL